MGIAGLMHRTSILALIGLMFMIQGEDALPQEGEPAWDDTNYSTALDPPNRRGRNPVYSAAPVQSSVGVRRDALDEPLPEDSGAGSSNFPLTVPIVRLPGRGLDVVLALNYNALLWHRVKDQMIFAPQLDDDWPAPGWSLGFGKLFGRMLFDADGTRHLLTRDGHTTDGTFIDCSFARTHVQCKYPTGLVIAFGQFTTSGFNYPTRITDANGNYIVITYRDVSQQPRLPPGRRVSPSIATITDTLGRTITFHYEPEVEANDSSGVLTAITGPGLNGQIRTLVRFNWVRRKLEPAFGGGLSTWPTSPSEIRVLKAVYYPGTATGYWFGDEDSYSSYGMVATVREQRGMSFAATPLTEQGVIEQGRTTRQLVYNYPLRPDPALTGAPTYTTMTERWEAMDTLPAVTTYVVQQNATPRRLEVTSPDGTRRVQLSYNTPREFTDGLARQIETYDASNKLLRRTTFTWQQGAYQSPRVTRVEATDELNQTTATEYSYGPAYNQVTEVREYDYGGQQLLSRVTSEYETANEYVQRHIYNLPKVVEVYQHSLSWLPNLASRTEYTYDGEPLAATPGIVQHSQAFNPDAPPEWVPPKCEEVCRRPCEPLEECEPECREECTEGYWKPQYDPRTASRGNITQITRYADAATRSGVITETLRYDIAGNLTTVSGLACCEQASLSYTSATQYAYPSAVTRGAANPASPARVTARANYDFDTGLVLSSTDDNGRAMQFAYDPATLRLQTVTWRTGATTSFEYDDAAQKITQSTRDSFGSIGKLTSRWLNGLGLVRRTETLASEGRGRLWDVVETKYDKLGRVWQQSRPFRIRPGLPPWNEIAYDALGRVTMQRAPDGSEVRSYYNEGTRPTAATFPLGQTARVVDAWGRERWAQTNALGQLVQVVEPNPDGSGSVFDAGSIRTAYAYNAFGQVVSELRGPYPSQVRSFRYDSLGRLTHQRLPEKNGTLNVRGVYGGRGASWSDVFAYDARSNLTSHTDARGVKTLYDYGNDPLNRLKSITYDTSGFGDTSYPIAPTPTVSYEYMTSGDVTRVLWVTTADVSTEEYRYDSEGRLSFKNLTLASSPSNPLTIGYLYDSLHRLWEISYPAQYGITGAPRALVRHDYDTASRVKGLSRNAALYASQITYNAASQMTSLQVGGTGPRQVTELYEFDGATGLLNRQEVQRAGSPLLDLSYDHLRWRTSSGRSGQLTGVVNSHDNQIDNWKDRSYEYDALGRLVKAIGGHPNAPLWIQTYSYDIYGNRTGVTATGNAASVPPQPIPRDGFATLSYDANRSDQNQPANRITSPGFTYDAAGNQTRAQRADGTWQRYQYDAAGRLKAVTDDAGAFLETYQYGASRQRLATETSGDQQTAYVRTYSVWSGDQVIAEYTETMPRRPPFTPVLRWTKSAMYLGGRLLATVTPDSAGEGVQYHHPDRLGTRLVTNGADTTVTEQVTLPFGVALDAESTGATNPRFTSYDRSAATGLDYAVNRFYHSQYGRFTQIDPLGMGAVNPSDPQSLNLYAYVSNDPINAVDPIGLQEIRCLGPQYNNACYRVWEWWEFPVIVVTGCCYDPRDWRPLAPGDLSRGSSSAGASSGGGGGSGARGGGPSSVSLHEAIYRGLGGQGPFPGRVPPTQIEKAGLVMLAPIVIAFAGGAALELGLLAGGSGVLDLTVARTVLASGGSIQKAIQLINLAGVSQSQAVTIIGHVVSSTGRSMVQVAGAKGSLYLVGSGTLQQGAVRTVAAHITAEGTATLGTAQVMVHDLLRMAVEVISFVPW